MTTRYVRVSISINPGQDETEFVKSVTGNNNKGGSYTTLAFAPRMYLKLQAGKYIDCPGGTPGRVSIPVTMWNVFSTLLSKVYKNIIETKEMYIRDDLGLVTCDRNKAKQMAKGFSVYYDKVVLTPTLAKINDRTEPAIEITSSSGCVGVLSLADAKLLIEKLETLDEFTLAATLAVLESVITMNSKIDRLEKKIDSLITLQRGPSRLTRNAHVDSRYSTANNPWGIGGD